MQWQLNYRGWLTVPSSLSSGVSNAHYSTLTITATVLSFTIMNRNAKSRKVMNEGAKFQQITISGPDTYAPLALSLSQLAVPIQWPNANISY
ncbi:hypothetical protein CVT25_007667, partial [Psilocybe cyanescens]